jgi:hypothetical protein
LKSIFLYTTNQIEIAKQTVVPKNLTTTTSMRVDYPSTTNLLSNPPLTGNFQIQCVRLDGTTALTEKMGYNT